MMYSLAIRKKLSKDDFFWLHDDYQFKMCDIDGGGRYWLADPFLFEKDGVTYIFYEAFDLVQHKGKIGYSIYNPDGSCTPPRMVLVEPYHLSFPYIFEEDGDIYIMPEGSADFSIKLYKAVDFPNTWEEYKIVNNDIFACDSVYLEKDNKRCILSNRMYHHHPEGTYLSCWVKNYLFPVSSFEAIGDGIKVSEGDFGIRNAGKPFMIGDDLHRVGQDCRDGIYGKGLVLFKVMSLSPYLEELIWSIDYKQIEPHLKGKFKETLSGVHTYNFSDHYEIIDYTYYRQIPFKTKLKRYGHLVKRLLEQIKVYI